MVQRVPTGNSLELENMAFMGTNVVSGSGTALVIATGSDTYFGQLAGRVTQTSRAPTQFQQGINRVSWILIRFMLVMAPVVMLINGYTKGDWLEALLFALAIAVGLTPEMLPMIVTATLAKGALRMSRRKVVVKRLDAIQNLGAMNVLCTDKTGTLTQDRIVLERHTDVYGTSSDDVLAYAYLNSYYQTGLKNLLDVAVLQHAEVERRLDLATRYRKVDEIPFDFSRRRMSVVVNETENGRDHHELICKGALEEMLSACTRLRVGSEVHPLTDNRRADIRRVTADLNRDGLRVIAVGVKEMAPTQQTYSVADESDLVLVGYIAFLDPPKESTGPRAGGAEGFGHRGQGADRRRGTRDSESVPRSGLRCPQGLPGRRDRGHGRRAAGACRARSQRVRPPDPRGTRSASCAACGPRATPWGSWGTASMMRPPCGRRTWAFRWTPRWIFPRRPPTSSCWKRA